MSCLLNSTHLFVPRWRILISWISLSSVGKGTISFCHLARENENISLMFILSPLCHRARWSILKQMLTYKSNKLVNRLIKKCSKDSLYDEFGWGPVIFFNTLALLLKAAKKTLTVLYIKTFYGVAKLLGDSMKTFNMLTLITVFKQQGKPLDRLNITVLLRIF